MINFFVNFHGKTYFLLQQKETLKCQKCQQGFPSKNKLFDHLQSSGHAVPLEASAPPAGEEKGKKGKKKNKR